METPHIACSYHPTTIVLVDDSETFVKSLGMLLLRDDIVYKGFIFPQHALTYIEEQSRQEQLVEKALMENKGSESYGLKATEHETKVDINMLHQEIYNPQRFAQSLVVIVDYGMPSMNGLEFCRCLKNNTIKKVMLTGEADQSLAINAFNDGLVDKFIFKGSNDFSQSLPALIQNLQKNAFIQQSLPLLRSLQTQPNTCFSDLNFIQGFEAVCAQHSIVEYYLIESTGSFLLLTMQGEPKWFIVVGEADLHDYYNVAEDKGASADVLNALREGTKIPYFPTVDAYMSANGENWARSVYPAQKIQGQHQAFYYALLDDLPTFAIERDRIVSYETYLEEIWKEQR